MNSRPSAGIQRQPQHSLSGTASLQRPPNTHRVLSHQYHTSDTNRKPPDNHVDLTTEAFGLPNGRLAVPRLAIRTPADAKASGAHSESPRSHAILSESCPAPEPRGRPRIHSDGESLRNSDKDGYLSRSATASIESKMGRRRLPMPGRPGHAAGRPSKVQKPKSTGSTTRRDSRIKPYALEIPSIAPNYPQNGHADFFPWTGDHPEDRLADHIIRQGYFDKLQPSQNETGSAKLSLFPSLKQKTGLHTLSSLITSVFVQRRAQGQIISPSTFKPPPRVTLTDTKRETWLRDLANPSISVRRLSRTIPHGIKGKALLEQCANKMIPTERAVWLAKCVGANEIRACKRKGGGGGGVAGSFAMGGEAKWVRDWTVFVEQFVDCIVVSCGEKDWKARIIYGIRLSAHLYAEHLLDREHYMDWLCASFENCDLARLPVWLLITQLYMQDLLQYRRFGRRVIAALCAHLNKTHEFPDRDILMPLVDRVVVLLRVLARRYPENFIMPKIWAKYRTNLKLYLQSDTPETDNIYDMVNDRNLKLLSLLSPTETTSSRRLIELLDKTLSRPFSSSLSKEIWSLSNDSLMLVQTVLGWSVSLYRPGVTKVYVGARLLRNWTRFGIDINDAVITFVGSKSCLKGCSKDALYHIVSELSRSGHFSLPLYIQWLIARGGIRSETDLRRGGSCASRLLVELSVHDCSENSKRLRKTMLSRAGFSVDVESQELELEIANMSGLLPGMFGSGQTQLVPRSIPDAIYNSSRIAILSRANKSELGLWAREIVSRYSTLPEDSQDAWKGEDKPYTKCSIAPEEFNIVRTMLEDCDDLSILADVLKMVTNCSQVQVLASAAETLNRHLNAFAAIGAMVDLFEALLNRLQTLSINESKDSVVFLASMVDLAARMPDTEAIARELNQELARWNRKTAADACSPVSDQMAEALHSSEVNFSDEVEKILASGTSMDKVTLDRLFEEIMIRLESSWSKPSNQQQCYCSLLSRLRNFDTQHFDRLISSWFQKLITIPQRPALSSAVEPLICLDCISFGAIIAKSASVLKGSAESATPTVALEILVLLFGSTLDEVGVMSIGEKYKLSVKRANLQYDFPNECICILRLVIEILAPTSGSPKEKMFSILKQLPAHDFLQCLVLADPGLVNRDLILPLSTHEHTEVRIVLGQVLDDLLGISTETKGDLPAAGQIEHTLQLADDLTLPFCQLKLQLIFTNAPGVLQSDSGDTFSCLDVFENAIDSAVAADNRALMSLVTVLDTQIAQHLCQRAERLFLHYVPSTKSAQSPTPEIEIDLALASRQLAVIEATAYSLRPGRSTQFVTQVVEKVNEIGMTLLHSEQPQRITLLQRGLFIMLRFIKIQSVVMDSSKSGSEMRSRILLSLSAILLEGHKYSGDTGHDSFLAKVFDVAILLVDDLPDEARLQCLRLLKEKASNVIIRYLFGYSAPSTGHLQLYQKGKLVPYPLKRWEILSEPTPNVGENDTSISLTLFQARKI